MASYDNRGINTTSLAENLSKINGLTDTNNQVMSENTVITLPKSIMLNNVKYKIKKDGTVIINNSILPDEYEQVEYIESSGTQYIDLKIYANLESSLEIDVCTTQNKTQIIFGNAKNHNPVKDMFLLMQCDNDQILCGFGSVTPQNIREQLINTTFVYHLYSFSKYGFYIDNNLYKTFDLSSTFTTPKSLTICRGWTTDSWGTYGKCRIRYLKYKDLLHNLYLIPCYSTTTVTDVDGTERPAGTVGMYDTIEGKFYVNKGTGTFGYGMGDGTYVAPSPTNN